MDAKKVYFRLTGTRAFLFQIIFTVHAIYFITEAGLNPLQLVLLGTVMEVSVLIFEVPTGVIADHLSRKWSVIIGTVILGCAHILEGSIPEFYSIAVAYALWGLGYTFLSGAEEAWIADEVQGKELDKLFFRSSQVGSWGRFAGIVVGVCVSYMESVQFAIIAAGAAFLGLAFWLMFSMPEKHFVKMERTESSHFGQLAAVLQNGFKTICGNTLLMCMAGITTMWGLASEGFDRLWEIHFLKDIHVPENSAIIWFGVINAIALLLNIGLVQWIKGKMEATGEQRFVLFLFLINAGLFISTLIFAFSGELWLALASYWVSYTFRGLNSPLFSIWINQKLESKGRATMLSLFGQLDAFGQIAGGPLVGWIALSLSISAGLLTTALFMVPVLFFLWISKRYASMGKVLDVTYQKSSS
ncbi:MULTISPECIES: MFS transporter [unclassified Bacillus (in: firmicutes)]|uniref:MFS transporter n=1 Tax=unclassified Bacillus (in: firmicutes) TaxID=185979 RepID=UPI0008EC8A30|nr:MULTISPECIES: MFS transporter [unclassified Bacillus (in: firmicutes)]SFA70182.1 MFS transporter, DHA3 family, tetracycline resistance protein [Bacillus sp. UNCCL13]SFQ59738.1 MFS transporter, DHA3 family, tetracycline resistance protein [Bacillus sp. cl95]